MGCGSSREANADNSPYAPAVATSTIPLDSSRAAINLAVPRSVSASHLSSARASSNNAAGQGIAATSRPNKPLRSASPVRQCPPERALLAPWTRAQLQREREAFFDTRVTGNPQVWEALRLVCEMLRADNVDGAQAMLDTIGLTCPTGRVKHERPLGGGHRGGVFDEMGVRYDVPGWAVVDPEDVLDDEELEKDVGALDGGEDDDEGEDAGLQRQDEKGKGREEEVGELVNVTARLSDRSSDVVVTVGMQQRVGVLVQRVQEKSGTGSKVRLAYMGKMLTEDKSLAAQGWREGHVINALVFG